MPRHPRADEPGSWHHVVNRGIAKRPLFETRQDQRDFLAIIARQVHRGTLRLHAFSLLNTHYHLLVESCQGKLDEAMFAIGNGYARHFNRSTMRDGPLFRGRYHSKRITSLAYRVAVVRYIDVNPVRARMVRTPEAYMMGSAALHVGTKCPAWLCQDWVVPYCSKVAPFARDLGEAYRLAFGQDESQTVRFVESRMGFPGTTDPLEELSSCAPRAVRKWLRQKALVSDGCAQRELPMKTTASASAAVARRKEVLQGKGDVLDGKARYGSYEVVFAGVLRDCSRAPWRRLGLALRCSATRAMRLHAVHKRLLQSRPAYLRFVAEIVGELVSEHTVPRTDVRPLNDTPASKSTR